MIEFATCFSGVVERGLTLPTGSMMNQPYWALCTGAWITFVFCANTTLSNSGTVWPFETVSLPQLFFEPGSCEYFFASCTTSGRCRSSAGCRSSRRAASSSDEDVLHVARLGGRVELRCVM